MYTDFSVYLNVVKYVPTYFLTDINLENPEKEEY
jgi:hypothetical protein